MPNVHKNNSKVNGDKCRLYNKTNETIDRITWGCDIKTYKEYIIDINRHDNVTEQIQ